MIIKVKESGYTTQLVPEVRIPILSFITDAKASPFDPLFHVNSGIFNWDLGDSSTSVDSNSFSHTYADTGNKTIKVYQGTADLDLFWGINMVSDNLVGTLNISSLTNLTYIYAPNNLSLTNIINPVSSKNITLYQLNDCGLTGTLDVSGLTGFGALVILSNNNLNYILNPNSSQDFTQYIINDNDLIGTLDMSGLSGLGGTFGVQNNSNLTQILNPTSSKVFTNYYAYDCSLSGALDLTGLTGLGGVFYIHNNSNLTEILNPVSSEVFTQYSASHCDLTGTLDVSGLTGLGGDFKISVNPNLTEILLPVIGNNFNDFDAKDCSLNLTTVDDIFVKFNTWYTSNTPTADTIINTSGGTSVSPTDGSSNTDIVNILSIFGGTAYDASITINY